MAKKKVDMSRRIKMGGMLVVVFLLLYIPSVIIWVYGDNVSTDIIRMGQIEVSINTDGYIVRNEEVLYSAQEGKCIREVEEGAKIRVNSTVATILNKSSEKLLTNLKDIDLRIININKDKVSNREFFSTDLKKIEDEIEGKLQSIISMSNSNSLSKVKKIKEEIDELIQKKATIVGDLGTTDVHLKSLLNEKKLLQSKIKENTSQIGSKAPGITSFIIDGLEDDLYPDRISSLTLSDLKEISSSYEKKNSVDMASELGKPVAKVIKDIDYYIVFDIETKNKLSDIKVDDALKIRINDIDKVIDGAIYYKSSFEDGKDIIAIRVNKALSETAGLRKINIDLITSFYDGLKVPLKSLENIDTQNMTADIALIKANRVRIKKVKIVGKNNDFAIIKDPDISFSGSISLYSSYVLNPKNIEEGQIIN